MEFPGSEHAVGDATVLQHGEGFVFCRFVNPRRIVEAIGANGAKPVYFSVLFTEFLQIGGHSVAESRDPGVDAAENRDGCFSLRRFRIAG
ncbi:MAG: hypothetical protein NTZ98_02820 [Acidobacteria bacterium]|nr:hypothetical protein [Acidobacteriota bacterium]